MAEHEMQKEKKACRPHTEVRTKYTRAVWPVTDAWCACWQDHVPQPKLNERSMMCLTCPVALGVDPVLWAGGLERRDLTQIVDREDDRPRVFVDYEYHHC